MLHSSSPADIKTPDSRLIMTPPAAQPKADVVGVLTDSLTTIVASTFPLPPSRPASPAPAPDLALAPADSTPTQRVASNCGASTASFKSRILVFLPPSHTDIDIKHVLDHTRNVFKDPTVTLDQLNLQFVDILTATVPATSPSIDQTPQPSTTIQPPAQPKPSAGPQFKFTVSNLHPSYTVPRLLAILIPLNHPPPTTHVLQACTVSHPRLVNQDVNTRTLTLGFGTLALAEACMESITKGLRSGQLKGIVCRGLRSEVAWIGNSSLSRPGAASSGSGKRAFNGRNGWTPSSRHLQQSPNGGHAQNKPTSGPSVTIANIDATAHRDDVLDILLGPIRDQLPAPLRVDRMDMPPMDPPTMGIRFVFATEAVVQRFAAYVERGVKQGEFVEITAPRMRLRVVHVGEEEEEDEQRVTSNHPRRRVVKSQEDVLLSEFARDLAEE